MLALPIEANARSLVGGTKEEWDALSPEAQAASWDSFDVLCARGIGDTHHFYQVLMKQCMVGYVGH
ncbi:hypothetical protein KEH59_01525 (plasmid) [Burkholderia contaminans]|uniref:hypothetical protein n=1 Tax=Burkholderia contaminans TaxID=488447 RepID=UPI001BAB4ABF|nr:hypothetical protein [Burkholderia contaminans]QUN44944.1 hypothetical protein KEH59_01525 [Burkholderia contaminans]